MTEPTAPSAARVRSGRRLALVVATARYVDPELRQLRTPSQDAAGLGALLADPDIGDFDVTRVVDATAQQIRLAVEEFTSDRLVDDLLVVFLSCHGLIDQRRRLYFAATDTMKQRLAATGIEAQWVLGQLDDCRARRQVVILDCCFSGAFASGAKGPDDDLGLEERFSGGGRGRVVLTASRASEYSFEGEPVPGSAMPGSVFTDALVRGISSGVADLDRDGYISVDDAYGYVFEEVRASGAQQTPQRWLYGAEGDIYLARVPAGTTRPPAGSRDQAARPGPATGRDGPSALGRWWHRRRTLAAALGAGLIAAVVVAAVVLRGPGPSTDTPSGQTTPSATASMPSATASVPSATPASSAGTTGHFAATAPWRLSVRGGYLVGDGCQVTLTNRDTGWVWRTRPVYNADDFQLQETGTIDWQVNDPRCAVFHLAGHGEHDLPLYQRLGSSDTPAFRPGRQASVKVTDFGGGPGCLLVLKDADTGDEIASASATPSKPTVVLDTLGHTWVYVAFSYCSLLITRQ